MPNELSHNYQGIIYTLSTGFSQKKRHFAKIIEQMNSKTRGKYHIGVEEKKLLEEPI